MTNQALTIRDDMTLSEIGQVFAKSGFFTDTRDAAQAIVKVLAGRELGIPPVAAMTGVYIVKGRVSLSAHLIAAAVKRTGKYNYRVVEHTDKVCELAFFENGQEVGRSRFTVEDARKAGTQNMDRFPRNMLFARAMSNGAKWFCPDATAGPLYTPDELGAVVNEDGEVIEAPAVPSPPEPPNGKSANAQLFDDPTGQAPTAGPAPEPQPEVKCAVIKGMITANVAAWQKGCLEIATKYEKYQTTVRGQPTGKPNYMHILGAAAKAGFTEVTDSNFELVLEAVAKRAADLAEGQAA